MYHTWRSYDAWFLRYKAPRTEFLVILGHFCSLTILTTRKNKILKKRKKHQEILSLYTFHLALQMAIMMHGSWDMEYSRQIFLSFWVIFCPFTPLIPWKNKIMKKWKCNWRCYHFTLVHHKWQLHYVWFLRYGARQSLLSFLTIFCPFTLLTTQKFKILKKWKKSLKISSFYTCVP